MKQSRATSFLKSVVSTAVGFAVAMVANALVLPLFGFTPSLAENLLITIIYTVISIGRGYVLERIFEAMGWRTRMSAFALAVLAERQRQITAEGWTVEHDDGHADGELARAGAAYAVFTAGRVEGHLVRSIWPWSLDWWKPTGFRRDLVKAAALIIAEGERHDRNRKRKPATASAAREPFLNPPPPADHGSIVPKNI
jgi:hypothetical protein